MDKKKTKLLPALVMLLGGGVAALLMLRWKIPFFDFARNLVTILSIFYVLGQVIRFIVEKNFPVMEDEEEETVEETEGEGEEGEETEEGEEPTENVDTEEAPEEETEEEEES